MGPLKKANKICKKLSCQYGIVNPPEVVPLKYSRLGNNVALGYYDNARNTIEINKYLFELWPISRIRDVITHELMHARCYQDFGHGGHGKRFKLLCHLYGVDEDTERAISRREG